MKRDLFQWVPDNLIKLFQMNIIMNTVYEFIAYWLFQKDMDLCNETKVVSLQG